MFTVPSEKEANRSASPRTSFTARSVDLCGEFRLPGSFMHVTKDTEVSFEFSFVCFEFLFSLSFVTGVRGERPFAATVSVALLQCSALKGRAKRGRK